MTASEKEFVYKLAGISGSSRPGTHRSRRQGAGMLFASHTRLFDQPDPRRIDLRASLKSIHRDWLVRSHHQRSAETIKVVVDVSVSMHFGSARRKLDMVADFLNSLGFSAYRSGDSVSLMAFDDTFRDDLYMPARRGRGIGLGMARAVSNCDKHGAQAGTIHGLAECVGRLTQTGGIVFLVSDFHWSLESLPAVLENLTDVLVVPLVVWDAAEIEPPEQGGWLSARDAESGHVRNLWMRKKIRQKWRDNVRRRRAEIASVFSAIDIQPFHFDGKFEAEALTRYFLEKVA